MTIDPDLLEIKKALDAELAKHPEMCAKIIECIRERDKRMCNFLGIEYVEGKTYDFDFD